MMKKEKEEFFKITSMLVFIPLLIIISAVFGYFYEISSYVPINIASPSSYLPNGDWLQEHRIIKNYIDQYGKVLIQRKMGWAYGSNNGLSFDSYENVMSYFRDYYLSEGWVMSDSPPDYQCQEGFPERPYLDQFVFEEYILAKGKICIVVIKMERLDWEDHDTFKVIVISSKFSPITEFLEAWRNW